MYTKTCTVAESDKEEVHISIITISLYNIAHGCWKSIGGAIYQLAHAFDI